MAEQAARGGGGDQSAQWHINNARPSIEEKCQNTWEVPGIDPWMLGFRTKVGVFELWIDRGDDPGGTGKEQREIRV